MSTVLGESVARGNFAALSVVFFACLGTPSLRRPHNFSDHFALQWDGFLFINSELTITGGVKLGKCSRTLNVIWAVHEARLFVAVLVA